MDVVHGSTMRRGRGQSIADNGYGLAKGQIAFSAAVTCNRPGEILRVEMKSAAVGKEPRYCVVYRK